MKSIHVSIVAAVVLVGCGESQQSAPAPEAKPVEPVAGAKAPDISIHEAANTANIEAVKQHIVAGTDVNARDKHDATPLHHVAFYGYKEIAELLIVNGADVNVKDVDGRTPLDMAKHHPETADLLRKHGGKISIHRAAREGNIESVKQYLDADTDVNAKGEKGRTPLHEAAYWSGYFSTDHKKIVELLIAEGADVNALSVDGDTPLDLAINYPETADLLRKHGGKTGAELK